MKRSIKISLIIMAIFIVLVSTFALTQYSTDLEFQEYLKNQELIEQNSIPVEVTGTINVTRTLEGYEYHFIPDSSELHKIQNTGMNITALESSWKNPVKLEQSLDGKKVTINGFIKKVNGNFDKHMWSGYPVLIVKKLEILN